MNITIFGSGYVGLVTGACLADVGNDVLCVDIDENKIARLNRGEVPIHEPGLDIVIARNAAAGRLKFTTDVAAGVAHGLFQFIAVGTPPDEDGSADLQYVLAVAASIGEHMNDFKLIVDKSTVPVGTADKVRATVAKALADRSAPVDFDVVSNPEFLKEGAAIDDFMKPDRIIVGVEREKSAELLEALYAPFNRNHNRMIVMDVRSAELTKYAANAMLATKISFMNEMANIADHVGADIEQVRIGMGSDPRIGYHFIYPGAGYGGSCFPKDVRALERTARQYAYDGRLLSAVEQINDDQKKVLFGKIEKHFDGNLKGRTIALWGLAFKPDTDDMREAPSRVLMEALWAADVKVRAFDPEAMGEARRLYGDRDDLLLCTSADEACEGADALVLMTEWRPFRSPNFDAMKAALTTPVVFDGRNVYDPGYLRGIGFTYYGIGRR
ncbi:MAG TPA: UDP-glucose/GDP-mannose dehydrogenase family protein [Gammaproteobacteria bacterium]|nr:UDP-glucose/GDP-mannose dehydrogenase family protein [Gammaproteobacteria bacterium]